MLFPIGVISAFADCCLLFTIRTAACSFFFTYFKSFTLVDIILIIIIIHYVIKNGEILENCCSGSLRAMIGAQ